MDAPGKPLLILGLGNDILTDDAVGLRVVQMLRDQLAGRTDVELRECAEMGLALLDHLVGFRAAVIVDSIQTGRAKPGFVHELDAASLKQMTGGSPHFLGVGEALAMGRQLGLQMPETVRIFAIEVADPFTLGDSLGPELTAALPGIVSTIRERVESNERR